MKHAIDKTFATVSILLVALTTVAFADRDALQEKLAQDVTIELTDVTMADALRQIGTQAGISIELSDEAAWKLPAGEQTRLSVTLEGQLAEGLEQMLSEFFLRYAVGNDSVVIYPRPELRRILGRPTPRLLNLLKNIYTKQAQIAATARVPSFAQGAINMFAGEPVTVVPMNEFNNASVVISNIAERAPSSTSVSSTVPAVTSVTLAMILDETVGGRSTVTWYISESEFPDQPAQIHIDSRLDFGRALFGQIVDASFENEEGLTVLRKLAAMANIDLQIVGEGALRSDGLRRRISLDALNVTVREALSRVTAALGAQVGSINFEQGTFEVVPPVDRPTAMISLRPSTEPSESGSVAPAAPAATAFSDDDYVGKISIPMGEGQSRYFIEFMLRERDLPDALRQLRAEKIREIFASFADSAEAD